MGGVGDPPPPWTDSNSRNSDMRSSTRLGGLCGVGDRAAGWCGKDPPTRSSDGPALLVVVDAEEVVFAELYLA
jgi:hypothetical protein